MSTQHTCKICNKTMGMKGFGFHLKSLHKITKQVYYDLYIKTENTFCDICKNKTNFISITKGYRKYCSRKCTSLDVELTTVKNKARIKTFKENPEIQKQLTQKRLKTEKENPKIKEGRSSKIKEFYKTHPEVIKESLKKRQVFYKNNPEVPEKALLLRKQTLESNPEINKNRIIKYQQTLRDNPEININKGNKISIKKRDQYKKLQCNQSTEVTIIYILKSCNKNIIKIGITSNFEKRRKEIINHFGGIEIITLKEGAYSEISQLETKLHKKFNNFCVVQPSGFGKTEWFTSDVLSEALDILNKHTSSVYLK